MKSKLSTASVIVSIVLLVILLWREAANGRRLREVALAAMRGDEIHLELHARSLRALESTDPEEVTATADVLRSIVAAGAMNIEARQGAVREIVSRMGSAEIALVRSSQAGWLR